MDHPNHITNHEKGKYLTYEDYLINTFFRNDRKSLWIAKAERAAALTSMGKTDKIKLKAGGEKMKLTQLHYFYEVYCQRNVSLAWNPDSPMTPGKKMMLDLFSGIQLD